MKERELMEKNLARLLKEVDYKSCGSDVEGDTEEDPVNPFMKRVFEKKMRRSSVASENMNPNFSTANSDYLEQNEHVKLQAIVQKGRRVLDKLESSTLAQIKQIKKQYPSKSNPKAIQKVLQGLQKTINGFLTQVEKQHPNVLPQLDQKTDQINHIEYYQCSSATNLARQTKQEKEKKNKKVTEAKIANMTGSIVGQANKSSQNKSVYESVLEERRNRKIKQSRVI